MTLMQKVKKKHVLISYLFNLGKLVQCIEMEYEKFRTEIQNITEELSRLKIKLQSKLNTKL